MKFILFLNYTNNIYTKAPIADYSEFWIQRMMHMMTQDYLATRAILPLPLHAMHMEKVLQRHKSDSCQFEKLLLSYRR